MVKRSKKSKSKRLPLRKKYKILKKVKEHQRKKAKEAKKLGFNHKRKVEKDPGIPNDWPFKEQELKALEARRARALEELEQKKAARKERAQKRKMGLLVSDAGSELPEEDFSVQTVNANDDSVEIGQSRDNSGRAFYKELTKVIDASDVILEVIDARDPLGTRCVDMEKMVIRSGPDKRLVVLLNKIDLVPREAVEKWLKYLREELPAVAFKCSTQEQKSNLGWKTTGKFTKPGGFLQSSDCLGAETLLKLLKNYSRSHEIKKSITVGVVGLPNVGKSSLINSLKRCHAVNVGATPGLTRSMQEVQLDKNVKLLDCPGVVMLSGVTDTSAALRNCKRIEKLEDPTVPVQEIVKLCPERILVTLYKLPSFDSADDFLQKVATVRGKLKKGGLVDKEAAARIVLHDWTQGKIPYYTMPPSREGASNSSDAKVVSEFSKEFNLEDLYNSESSVIGSLRPIDDITSVEVLPSNPFDFDERMIEEAPGQLDDDDDAMGCEGDGKAMAGGGKNESCRQNEKLYEAEGIFNPKVRRAEKKKMKKAKKLLGEDAIDDDYDFKVDYGRNRSNGDDHRVGDESMDE